MLFPRVIPCLLIHNNGVVKTTNFKNPRYIGDPINAVKIFNEKSVDELIILDIDATVNSKPPNYELIEKIAVECRMPISYGGGVKTKEQVQKIISLGVEKVSISSAFINDLTIINELSESVGNQSLSITIDIKSNLLKQYQIVTNNAKKNSKYNLDDVIDFLKSNPIGEVIINSVDKDGTMNGYDFKLIDKFYSKLKTPITVIGGAGCLEDLENLINRFGLIGAAAGSLFVYKGIYKAVLLNYPSEEEKETIFSKFSRENL
tara:strand:- start:10781 stop:11563 length:783 start_codon:yes stop_codon:yes gene_type:complete